MGSEPVRHGVLEAVKSPAFWRRATPYLIGAFFALGALRGLDGGNPIHSDAPRHALNGAMIHDFLRSGRLGDPLGFARDYYGRLPAISIPYHPPLFPAVEALSYAVFGVNLGAARLTVAVAVLACAVLLFRLVEATHGSWALAAAVSVCFLSLPPSRFLAGDVMLEFPALAFTLGALLCLCDLPRRYGWRQALGFALLAGAAVWTKQQTVSLGLVPFLCVALGGGWRLLKEKPLWVSSALLAALVLLLLRLPVPETFRGYANEVPVHRLGWLLSHHVSYYLPMYVRDFGLPAALFVGGAAALALVRRLWKDAPPGDVLYLAWVLGLALFLLLIGKVDDRYPFLAYPALVALGVLGLSRLSGLVGGARWAAAVPVAAAVVALAFHLRSPVPTMSGPAQAAEYVVRHSANRVLYCGQADGAFVFAVRAQTSYPGAEVVRGDRMPAADFAPDKVEAFARRHGIEYIVLEDNGTPRPWSALWGSPPASVVLEEEMPLRAYPHVLFNGTLRIYRFTDPSRTPEPIEQRPLVGEPPPPAPGRREAAP
jgi:hypothetical protein